MSGVFPTQRWRTKKAWQFYRTYFIAPVFNHNSKALFSCLTFGNGLWDYEHGILSCLSLHFVSKTDVYCHARQMLLFLKYRGKGAQEVWVKLIQFECFRSQLLINSVSQYFSQHILIRLDSCGVRCINISYKNITYLYYATNKVFQIETTTYR